MEATGITGTPLTYVPPPNESPYYEALFVAADHTNSGYLGGREAVNFLSRSKLPLELLKNIWGMADKPQTNILDKNKFFVAIRLIQLFQNGEKAQDPTLTCTNVAIRAPFFDGVTGVTIQPFDPSTSVQQAPVVAPVMSMEQRPNPIPLSPGRPPVHPSPVPQVTSTLAVQDPYTMLPVEQSRYETLFPQYVSEEDGFVHGREAVGLFSKSGLDKGTLRDIWNMVDDPIDNRLSKLEFAMAMHLIVCISKKNLPVPPSLPMSLKSLKEPRKKPVMAGNTAAGPPPLATQAPQPPPHQQYVSPTVSFDAASSQQHSFQNTGHVSMVTSGGDSVMGGVSTMGGGASVISTGMSITDAFGDLNPEEVAKAGEGYYLSNTQEPTSTQVSQPPPVPTTNAAPFVTAQPDQNPNPTSYQPESYGYQQPAVENSFNPNPSAMFAAPTMSAVPAPVLESSTAPIIAKPNEGTTSSTITGNNDSDELEKMKSVLQKLQAENISLKAQMGHYTAEELQVRSDITKTIEEIGTMSQDMAALRVQVSDARAALIEATTELKFRKEKKQETQDIISDLGMASTSLNAAVESINEIKANVDFNQPSSVVAPVPEENNFFEFQAPAPIVNNTPVANNTNNFDLMGGAANTFNPINVPMNDTREAQYNQSSLLSGDDLSYQSLHQVMSSRTVEEVDELKDQAKNSANAAQSADDHARALAMQLDNIKVVVEEAEKIAEEKQTATKGKKKGFGRGNKKASKDAEAAVKDASEKKKHLEEAEAEKSVAEAQAKALKDKANKLQQQAEQAEIELAQAASMMHSNATAPVPANTYDLSHMSSVTLATNTSVNSVNTGNGHSNTNLAPVNYGGASMGGVGATLTTQPNHGTAQPNPPMTNQGSDYANPFGF